MTLNYGVNMVFISIEWENMSTLPPSRSTWQKRTNLLADKGLIIKKPLEYVQHDAKERRI